MYIETVVYISSFYLIFLAVDAQQLVIFLGVYISRYNTEQCYGQKRPFKTSHVMSL